MSQQWNSENNNGGGDEDVQMPLGTGDPAAPAEEYNPSSGSRFKVNTSTIALVAAFAAALVVLYLLGLQNKPRQATAQEQKHAQELEEKITHMLNSKQDQQQVGDFLRDTPKLLDRLNKYFDSGATTQDLPSNPFEHAIAKPPETDSRPLVHADTTDPEKAKRLVAIDAELNSLKVNAVMMGRNPSALIGKNIVSIGTSFKYLKVVDIQPDRVLLTADGETYELKVAGSQINK